jgi:hypothetical protein
MNEDLNPAEVALRLDQITELSVDRSNNHDIPLLLEHILGAAKNMTHADGGTLYRISDDKQSLCFNISINDSVGMCMGGVDGQEIEIPGIALFDGGGKKTLNSVAAYAANFGHSVNIYDI